MGAKQTRAAHDTVSNLNLMRARRRGGFDLKRVNWPNNAQAGGLLAAAVPYTEKLLTKNMSRVRLVFPWPSPVALSRVRIASNGSQQREQDSWLRLNPRAEGHTDYLL